MLNQSFRQVFVSNIPALLPEGKTVENIAVGQIGILDGASYVSTTTPTYGKNKALRLVWGSIDLAPSFFFGNNNQNEYTKLIKGKLIRGFRGHKASRGQNQVITVGYSGDVADTNTLFAKPGEHRELFLNLTGDAIDREFSNQGLQRRYYFKKDYASDCEDACVDVNPIEIAESLVKQINADTWVNRYVKASVIVSCDPALAAIPSVNVYKFRISVIDAKDYRSLGLVQAQYPNDKVKKVGEDGFASVYEVTRTANTLPTAYSNAGNIVIPECDVCPTGYTLINQGFSYKLVRQDAGDATAQTAIATEFSLDASEKVSRVGYEYGQSTYTINSDTALADAAGLSFLGEIRHSCLLNTATTTAWTAAGTMKKYAKTYRIRLADDICGNDRLADLQAAYPDLVITLVDAAGDCVHTYETTVYSQPVEDGCSVDVLEYVAPDKFEGALWDEVPPAPLADGTTCLTGIKLEVAVVNRTTNEATFQYFPYDASVVYAEVSSGNADYNSPVPLENFWAVKQIQGVKFPQGAGGYIQGLEKDSLAYNLKQRSDSPVLRQLEGYEFQAQNGIYYDEYVLEFDFSYKVGGWSQTYTDSYSLFVYFPEGQGKAFETAINNYLASASIQIDPVIL